MAASALSKAPDPALSKAPDRIADMFDAIAPRYDFLNHLLTVGIDRFWRRRAIRALALSGRERVLDLCTGTGDLAIAACRGQRRAARVIGLDFAAAMLRVGREKIARRRLDRVVSLVQGDAMRTPVADRSVDAVMVAFGIRNVEKVGAVFEEMYRVLKPGGRIAILEFAIPSTVIVRVPYLWYFRHVLPRIGAFVSRHARAYGYLPASVGAFASPDEVVTILRQAGFVDVRADPVTLGIVVLYTAGRASSARPAALQEP